MHSAFKRLTMVVLATASSACAVLEREEPYPDYSALSAQAQSSATKNGSIYQSGQGMALFSDQKAVAVGDVLTVLLVETTTAKSSAATSTSKSTNTSITPPTILGQSVTRHGIPVFDTSLESEHSFDGKGDSTQSNTLQGNISVMVVQRLPNGNLVVSGEKRLKLNQGDETVKVEGVVRPQDVGADNTIPSSRIANARISYSGRGTLAESNQKGWLARFFSSEWMPF